MYLRCIKKLENKELRAKKMGQKSVLKTLPHKGWMAGQSSNHFIAELIEMGDFSKTLTKNK